MSEMTPVMEPKAVEVENKPFNGATSSAEGGATPNDERTWSEELEMAGSQLVERVKELIAEGNVRRLIIRTSDDRLLMEIPLTGGAVVGGVVILFAPLLAALGALAALIAHVKVEVVRTDAGPNLDETPKE